MNEKREIVEEVFGKNLADSIWSANTLVILPLTPQGFALGSVLPAIFFTFRRGRRRGKGKFNYAFSQTENSKPSIYSVAGRLTQDKELFDGFDSEIEKDILGDLLLCDALENKKHEEGHHKEIQRAYPVHFFSSWLDLPQRVAHLRFVPEMLVCILKNQRTGSVIQPNAEDASFSMGASPEQNLFFKTFARGMIFSVNPADLSGDKFDESVPVSVEELLMIRLAQACKESPETLRATHGGTPDVTNCFPISQRAMSTLREDLTVFLESYGDIIPRRAITPMLESILGLGLLMIYLESSYIAIHWDQAGEVIPMSTQKPVSIFADTSTGNNALLRDISENSFQEVIAMLDQSALALMAVRILDAKCKNDRILKDCIPQSPDTSEWLNLLGQIRQNKHTRSEPILNDLFEKIEVLKNKLDKEGTELGVVESLHSKAHSADPVRMLSDCLCTMMGDKALRSKYITFLDSCLMLQESHALASKRRVSRSIAGRKKKTIDVRSFILSNTLLETLVHIHLIKHEGSLSLATFIQILRERYGIWVDECPPGLSVSREDLLRNRSILEKRLRDLGLLVGVNDAEFMKHLRPRFSR